MFNPEMLNGQFVHLSHGSRLEESDDLVKVVDAMIDWIVTRPDRFVRPDESVEDSKTGKIVAVVLDVSRSIRYVGPREESIVTCIDTLIDGRYIRFFPQEENRGHFPYRYDAFPYH